MVGALEKASLLWISAGENSGCAAAPMAAPIRNARRDSSCFFMRVGIWTPLAVSTVARTEARSEATPRYAPGEDLELRIRVTLAEARHADLRTSLDDIAARSLADDGPASGDHGSAADGSAFAVEGMVAAPGRHLDAPLPGGSAASM
jgi:hypothetical protein